jgi:DNA-damage-inducible protein J
MDLLLFVCCNLLQFELQLKREVVRLTTISVRLDDQDKRDLDALCAELGMNIATFYSIYTKKALREWKIPFEVSANKEQYAMEALYAKLEAAEKERNEGRMLDGPSVMAELMEG